MNDEYRFFVVWQAGSHSGPYQTEDECYRMLRAYKRFGAKIVKARYESIGGNAVRLFSQNGKRLT